MKYYLAYGSNLNIEQMRLRCPDSKKLGVVILKDYRLVFKGDYIGYLTLEKSIDSSVELGLYQISKNDEIMLDKYEGYPQIYEKAYLKVGLKGIYKDALIYIMNEEFDYKLPSKQYLNICLKGFKDFNFDINKLYDAVLYTNEQIKTYKFKK